MFDISGLQAAKRILIVPAVAMALMARTPAALADPVWSFDSASAFFYATSDASLVHGVPPPQSVMDSVFTFAPNFMVGMEQYDHGNAALAVSELAAPGWALAASGVSVLGIRGAGTPVIEVFFRTSTLNDASAPPLYYEAVGNAQGQGFLPLQILGAPANTSYRVNCQFEYFGNAVTIAENGQEDQSRASGFLALVNGLGNPLTDVVYPFAGSYEGTNSNGTQTGMVGLIAGSRMPGELPYLNAQFSTEAHSHMESPGIGAAFNEDLCGSEFYGRAILTIGSVCNRPSISSHPGVALVCPSGSGMFSVTANGGGPLTYHWQYDTPYPGGHDWNDLTDGGFPQGGTSLISGAETHTLTISNVDSTALTNYRCVVSNECGPTISNAAPLFRFNNLPGDTNFDGLRDGVDVQGFVNTIVAGPVGPASIARCGSDMNADGMVNDVDVPMFIAAILAG